MQQHGFPKADRLRNREEYLRLKSVGRAVSCRHFLVVILATPGSGPRLGITASRKVGGAVERNRIRRLVREYFRLHRPQFSAADYHVIARRGAADLSYHDVCRELDRAMLRSA